MSRSSSGSGLIAPYAPGQENAKYNVLFDESSEESTSHAFVVDNNFVRVAAFNLAPGDVVTIEQITGLAAGDKVADYAPIHGPVKLYWNSATDQRTSYILERAGRYRAKLSSGVGSVHVYAIQYFIENEASQDIADALYAVLNSIIAPNPCSIGAVIPADTTANNDVVSLNDSNCLVHQQLVSSGTGNLIQLRPDGVYYGILPPPNFANQYVSSSTGNDANPGTQIAPLKTIQKAISNLPDGTSGNIFLKAGDTFYSYPTATGDLVNTLTQAQTATAIATLNVGDRQLNFAPYNDTPVDDIINYNATYSTLFDPYRAAETNFPIIVVNISLTTDTAAYFSIHYKIGVNGSITFNACDFRMANLGGTVVSSLLSAISGFGTLQFHGGHLTLGSGSIIGEPTQTGSQTTTFRHVIAQDGAGPPASEFFCFTGTYYTINTLPAIAPGGIIVPFGSGGGPGLPYTDIGDNTEAFLATAALWDGITVYSTAFRSFRHVFTSIPIA